MMTECSFLGRTFPFKTSWGWPR